MKVDLDGAIIGASAWGINPAGFTPHAAIHRAIDRAHCVMHTHTTTGMAVACSAQGLSISNFYAAQLGHRLAYHDFEGITVHADEGARLLESIGDRPAVILRNHGLLAWARPCRRRSTCCGRCSARAMCRSQARPSARRSWSPR